MLLLTREELRKYLDVMRVSIPESFEKELLEQYGNYAVDEEGHVFEYTAQDIYEQLRKKIRPYQNCS